MIGRRRRLGGRRAYGRYDIPLDLNMHPFETTTLLVTVLLVGVLIQPGQSHWLLGFVLICAYVVISMGFFVHVDPPSPPALR